MRTHAWLGIVGGTTLALAAVGMRAHGVPTADSIPTLRPGQPAPVDQTQGRRLYADHCAACHGSKGDGKGPNWLATMPRPQVFIDGNYMARLTDQYLFEVVKYGKLAVVKQESVKSPFKVEPMPAFGGDLSDEEIRELLAFQRTLRGSGSGSDRMRGIFQENCLPCHGPRGQGNGRLASKRQPAPPEFVSDIQPAPADITDPLFMNRFSDTFLIAVIRKGWIDAIQSGDFATMKAFGDVLSDQDIWSVVRYIRATFANGHRR